MMDLDQNAMSFLSVFIGLLVQIFIHCISFII